MTLIPALAGSWPARPGRGAEPRSSRRRIPVQKSSLTALAHRQLVLAHNASSGRSAQTVYGGHEHLHALEAVEDAVVLLTVSTRVREEGR